MSHHLNHAECNYSATDQEFIAIVPALKHWRHYLLGKPFVCRTDHTSLKWLQMIGADSPIFTLSHIYSQVSLKSPYKTYSFNLNKLNFIYKLYLVVFP